MTEYTGFISDIIRRSDAILRVGRGKQLEVTALLLLFSAGYLMPFERLKYWCDDDRNLKLTATHGKIKKLAEKVRFGVAGSQPIISEFSGLNLGKWKRYTDPDTKLKELVFRRDILPRLTDGSLPECTSFSLHTVMWDLRNSLAHGGVHPLSQNQISLNDDNNARVDGRGRQLGKEITTVFFVSEIEYKKGISVFKVPVSELEAFWEAWKSLLINDLGCDDLAELDIAA